MNLFNEINTEFIVWKKHPSNIKYYSTKIDGIVILLRLNNFPEEPLLTFINGLEILDIEEKPNNWLLE